jgi:hypothetical protein
VFTFSGIDDLIKQSKLIDSTRVNLAKSVIGVGVRKDAPKQMRAYGQAAFSSSATAPALGEVRVLQPVLVPGSAGVALIASRLHA